MPHGDATNFKFTVMPGTADAKTYTFPDSQYSQVVYRENFEDVRYAATDNTQPFYVNVEKMDIGPLLERMEKMQAQIELLSKSLEEAMSSLPAIEEALRLLVEE